MAIAIIGAGYVGLPLAIAFAKYNQVICYDISHDRIQKLKQGVDTNKQHSKKEVLQKKLVFTNDADLLKKISSFIITVPTPTNISNHPDLSMLEKASLLVGKYISKKSTVVYESTTYPGCTEEFCIPLLEQASNLKYGKDFEVAYSPERVNPGDKINTLESITKIVGSNHKSTLKKISKLYKTICKSIYPVNSIKIAESAKVIENIQRDVNIALVNELSVLFHKLNIPTNEVLKAAASKWNFHYYQPGLVGGHCIGIDPYYLAYKAEQHNYFPQLILSGRRFNENMGKYVATQTIKLLIQNNINPSKARIAILGFAFKQNIVDFRNTKVIQIVNELQHYNIDVTIFDSQVSKSEVQREYNLNIYDLEKNEKNKFDCLVIAVPHKEFIQPLPYYNQFFKNTKNKIIVDLKNIFHSRDLDQQKFKYFQL